MRYFINEGAAKQGPFDVPQLHELAERGDLTTDDLLTTEDGSARIRAGLVVGVFGPVDPAVSAELEERPAAQPERPGSRRRFLVTAVALLLTALLLPFVATVLVVPLIGRKLVLDRQEVREEVQGIVTATFAYAADHDDHLPPFLGDTADLQFRLQRHMKGTPRPFSSRGPGAGLWTNKALSTMPLSQVKDAKRTVLFYEPTPWSDGKRVVAMADGSIQTLDEKEFMAIAPSER